MKKIIGYIILLALLAGSICGITYGIKYAVLSSQTDPEYTEELENKVSDYQSQMNTYYLTILDLQSQINDLKLQGTTDSATISSLETTITSLNSTVESLTASNTSNEETIAQNEETIAELQATIKELEADNTDKSNEITTLNNTISSLQTLNESLQATNNSNLALITSLNAQIVTLNEQIATLTNQITDNTDTVTKLNTEIANLQKTISTYETYIASLETDEQAAVTFMYNGSVWGLQIVTKGTYASISDPPSTDYLVFNGWTLDGETIIDLSEQEIKTNTVFTASVTNYYAVSFVSNGETIYSDIIVENGTATAPTDPTLDGYTFDGWTVDGVTVIDLDEYEITGTTTFTAKFTALHTVSFIYEDETILTQSVRDGEYATAPSVESTTYKTFNGWLLNGSTVTISTYKIIADMVFYADVTYSYDVTFISNGETYTTQVVESGSCATLPTDPTLEGYTFDGWTIDGETVIDVSEYEIIGATTFTAKFTDYYVVLSVIASEIDVEESTITEWFVYNEILCVATDETLYTFTSDDETASEISSTTITQFLNSATVETYSSVQVFYEEHGIIAEAQISLAQENLTEDGENSIGLYYLVSEVSTTQAYVWLFNVLNDGTIDEFIYFVSTTKDSIDLNNAVASCICTVSGGSLRYYTCSRVTDEEDLSELTIFS